MSSCAGKETIEACVFDKKINIPVVNVTKLCNYLKFESDFNYPQESLNKPLNQWKMEIDDSPIFRYIYRQFQPKRHLEFGTWQGAGIVYCLEETNASIWTLNLPFGEKKQNGDEIYSNYPSEVGELQTWANKIGLPVQQAYHTDSIGFIGRKYLEKNFGNRVCQIYCDSREWDISCYPEGFFDSVLIDGGHLKEIVVNDTKKAFPLLKRGGVIMWHDFCPPVWNEFEVTRGVMEAVSGLWDFIVGNTSEVFWIEPSWILVGIKK